MVAEDIIIRPIITEKSIMAQTQGKYTFEVNKKATKIDIKNAVEKLFEVKVKDVATMNMTGKTRRRGYQDGKTSDWKKAVVTIDTNPTEKKFLKKGGIEATSSKKFKTSIEEMNV